MRGLQRLRILPTIRVLTPLTSPLNRLAQRPFSLSGPWSPTGVLELKGRYWSKGTGS